MSYDPKSPRPSATVILVRREGEEASIYLLRRSRRSGFMGGFYVFPGGSVETRDRGPHWYRHLDMAPQQFAEKFGDDPDCDEILAHLVAAVRETIEEAGVLLADRSAPPAGGDPQAAGRPRRRGHGSGNWFAEEIAKGGWRLSASRLYPWARWITPEQMRSRFDTRFFLAVMPEGRRCRPDGRETVHGVWSTARMALEANCEGRIPLSPPTLMTLQGLLKYPGYDALLQAAEHRRWGNAKMPRLVRLQKGDKMIMAPWDPDYSKGPFETDIRRAELLPAGAAFSRMLLKEGCWRPITIA